MNLLEDKIKPIFFKYLSAAFGSTFIAAIYSIVDMSMVGQYHGPKGSAAMSVIMPVFNIIYSLGLFTGIGGAVLFSAEKGKEKKEDENMFFTTALVVTVIFALIAWGTIVFFELPLMRLFGAEETLLPLTTRYLSTIKYVIPVFVFNQMMAAFLRNDNAPGLATGAVLCGGIFNIFGDYFFVFTLDLGITGAGLATSIGTTITLLIMLTHFVSKSNSLRIVRINKIYEKIKLVLTTGFSTFFVDFAVGIITMLFNLQIVKYLGTNALAVYGVIGQISMFAQCCAYSVGQASQPILSINYSAKKTSRIKETLRYALLVVAFFSVLWVVLMISIPNEFIQIFMKPTAEVLKIAPTIMRVYGMSFLLLPLNIFSTYYFQSLMKPKASFIISVGRGLIVSGALIVLLPIISASAVWFAMPITEVLIAVYVIIMMIKYTKNLSKEAII
jgi:putative MATE family efflux protein